MSPTIGGAAVPMTQGSNQDSGRDANEGSGQGSDRGAALVAVDWGTTSCRFVLVAADGRALERRSGPGIIPLTAAASGAEGEGEGMDDRAETFERALREQIEDWLDAHPGIPVMMCGMVGSDRGWRDAGYREAPTAMRPGPEDLVEVALPGHPAYLVPGIKQHHPAPDVMRGEETQVLGALLEVVGSQDGPPSGALLEMAGGQDGPPSDALVLAPGTHSKWVRVSAGTIEHFRTYMTGDLFAALLGHTILASPLADQSPAVGPEPSPAFLRGLELALGEERASLSRHLFRARSGLVLGELALAEAHDFLSGLLIGDEVADALALLTPDPAAPVLLIASEQLAPRYRAAVDRAGLRVRQVDGDPATRGLHAIARGLRDHRPLPIDTPQELPHP